MKVGGYLTAAMVDDECQVSVADREMASRFSVTHLGTKQQTKMGRRTVGGDVMRVTVAPVDIDGHEFAEIDIFVPENDMAFRKGIVLGADFLDAAGLRIDAETGETYCPRDMREKA